jgi:hypothetical protein
MENFINSNFDNLIKIYIQERQTKQELGCLFIDTDTTTAKINVKFIELSNPILTDEFRNDVLSKNNYRNSNMFVIADNKLYVFDLEKK